MADAEERAGVAPRLSVAVITLDEEDCIGRCLESVRGLADEIVVVDSGSTDATGSIVESCGGRFVHRPWKGFVAQKNEALSLCRGEWILCLDADEWLSDELRESVARIVRGETPEADEFDAWMLDRMTTFLGASMRCWSPDWIVRLVRRGRARYMGGLVHESLVPLEGARVGRLRGKLMHDSYSSVSEYLERMNRYTSLAAEQLYGEGRRFSAFKFLFSPPWMFLRLYFGKLGVLDGWRGLFLCASSGYYVFLKYFKLLELEWRGGPSAGGGTPGAPTS